METRRDVYKDALRILLKEFSTKHTVSSLAKELKISRTGTWKLTKKLEEIKYLSLLSIGTGKTSTCLIDLNWDNIIVEKALALYLTEEAVKQQRWQINFNELEAVTDFVILYGSVLQFPRQANDIDILGITSKNNFVNVHNIIDKLQKTQSKKIHALQFTDNEFKAELKGQNRAFIDAMKKGVVLFGQENFVKFMKNLAK